MSSSRKRKDVTAEPAAKKVKGKGKAPAPADVSSPESPAASPAEAMTVAELKDALASRGLITKGLKADLVKRLAARLEREKDPAYKPRGPEKARMCPWCGTQLEKKVKPKSDRIDRFYGCPRFPDCTYTENMSGHSKKKGFTPEEQAKDVERAKKLGTAMQTWKRSQWADYNSR